MPRKYKGGLSAPTDWQTVPFSSLAQISSLFLTVFADSPAWAVSPSGFLFPQSFFKQSLDRAQSARVSRGRCRQLCSSDCLSKDSKVETRNFERLETLRLKLNRNRMTLWLQAYRSVLAVRRGAADGVFLECDARRAAGRGDRAARGAGAKRSRVFFRDFFELRVQQHATCLSMWSM